MMKLSIALWALLIVAATVATFLLVNRPRKIIIDAPVAADFPEQGFSHAAFEDLLQEYVTPEGEVDYARWLASNASLSALDSYLAAVSRFSPENAPERFPTRSDTLAYWLYGYNAYVIKGVLDRWPLSSVTDVRAPIEAVKGLGFFYQLRFSFGGEYISLFSVENDKIRARYREEADQSLREWSLVDGQRKLLIDMGLEADREMAEDFFNVFYEPISNQLTLFADAPSVLSRLKKCGKKIAFLVI